MYTVFIIVDPRDEEEERPNRGNGNRRPPSSCEELACGPAESEKCQEFKVEDGRQQRAFCIPNGESTALN